MNALAAKAATMKQNPSITPQTCNAPAMNHSRKRVHRGPFLNGPLLSYRLATLEYPLWYLGSTRFFFSVLKTGNLPILERLQTHPTPGAKLEEIQTRREMSFGLRWQAYTMMRISPARRQSKQRVIRL